MREDSIRKEGLFDGGDTTVTITLDNDEMLECVVLTIFEAGDREYIAVLPTSDENNDDAENNEVYLYRYAEDKEGQPMLTNIETDEEYETVADAFDEILDEQEFNELMEQADSDDTSEQTPS